MTNCVQCGEEMGIATYGLMGTSIYVCEKPDCPNFSLAQFDFSRFPFTDPNPKKP